MAAPPLLLGADHAIVTDDVVSVVADTELGASGTVRGVADNSFDVDPVPTLFTADTRNRYGVPFDNEVTIALVEVEPPSENKVQLEPPSDDHSTM